MAAKPVVAGTDGSEESLRAVDWAAREAAFRGLPLRIVSAAALLPRMAERQREAVSGLDTVSDTLRKDRARALAAAEERVRAAAPDLLVDVDELIGAPGPALAEAGSGAAMLVVGARGIGAFTAMVLGSVSQYVAAHAACPVVVVREETAAAHRQVGVGVGDPARSAAALAFAFQEAALRKASLIALHAWDSPYGQVGAAVWDLATPGRPALQDEAARQLDSVLAEWQGEYPDVEVSHDFVHAHPGRALAGLSARADLVVLGRHTAHGALPGAGAVRHAVLNHAHGPVVTVPSP
jgi:nucleotide-binding universal stress UspA family protein